jgi:hypothetical protein
MPIEIIDVDDPEIVITKHTISVPEDDPDVVHLRMPAANRQHQPWHVFIRSATYTIRSLLILRFQESSRSVFRQPITSDDSHSGDHRST